VLTDAGGEPIQDPLPGRRGLLRIASLQLGSEPLDFLQVRGVPHGRFQTGFDQCKQAGHATLGNRPPGEQHSHRQQEQRRRKQARQNRAPQHAAPRLGRPRNAPRQDWLAAQNRCKSSASSPAVA